LLLGAIGYVGQQIKRGINKMENSKKLLILAVVIILVVSSVIVTIFVIDFARDGVDHKSGIFTLDFQSKGSDSWTFSAQSAQGYSIIFRDLSQEDLNKISVESSIAEGEMFLILSQDENSQSIDLSEGTMKLSSKDMGMDAFNPGRISMQLKFNNAKNLAANISWH